MGDNLRELLGLFLNEATGRLERLARLAPLVEADPDAALAAQRELHALKGAARMLGLQEVAEACHRAEELAGRGGGAADAPALVRAVDELTAQVDAVGGGTARHGEPAASKTETRQPQDSGEALRVPRRTMDRVTDLGTRLRILSHGLARPVGELERLATLAERGVSEEDPAQVLAALASTLRSTVRLVESAQVRLGRAAREQVELLLELQMQPLEPTFLELARHARELARELGKEVEVKVAGGEVRLDRRITSALFDSLVHLVRNAVDHGLETPEERRNAGKPERGLLEIRAVQEGERVLVTVADDGRGLDLEAIFESAARRGLDPEQLREMRAEEIVLLPGFTTRSQVSQVSGRGIGLDAVASAVRALGGVLGLQSSPGRGLAVTLDLPAARRGRRVVVVSAHDLMFAVPVSRVRAYYVAGDVERVRTDDEGWAMGRVGDRLAPLILLTGEAAINLFLEVEARGRSYLVGVQAVRGVEEVMTRTLPGRVRNGTLFEESAVLGTGEAVPVLTFGELARPGRPRPVTDAAGAHGSRRLRILLVDDSPVTREMERRLLEDAGLYVEAVPDAATALSRLGSAEFDCLVTDIEMPGMDGLELTRSVRRSDRLGALPVVLVSTRSSAEDRLAGLDAGADAYIAKQEMQPGELAVLVRRLAGGGG